MKKIKFIVYIVIFCFISLHVLEAAEVKFMVGSVTLNRKSRVIKGYPGLKILTNDVVRTGKKSMVIISTAGSDVIKIREKSVVKISQLLDKKNITRLQLRKGSIFSKVVKGKKSRFRIRAQTVVASVRGTEFFFAYGKEKDLWLCVNEGKVAVKKIGPGKDKEVIVEEGKGIFITGGSKITDPKEYSWTRDLNWNMNPGKGDVEDTTDLGAAYTDLLDQDYD